MIIITIHMQRWEIVLVHLMYLWCLKVQFILVQEATCTVPLWMIKMFLQQHKHLIFFVLNAAKLLEIETNKKTNKQTNTYNLSLSLSL